MKADKYLSMRQAAALLGMSYTAFRSSYRRGFFPFRLVRYSAYRNKFRRVDIEAYAAALEPEKIVTLPAGEVLTDARPEASNG